MDPYNQNDPVSDAQVIKYAAFWQRALAAILDGFILVIPFSLLYIFALLNKSFLLYSFVALGTLLYKPLMEGTFGATLGKMAMKLRCVDVELQTLQLNHSFLKNAIYIIGSTIGWAGMYLVFNNEAFLEAEGLFESLEAMGEGGPLDTMSSIWSAFTLGSCLAMVFDPYKRQTLHDKLANSFCIHEG